MNEKILETVTYVQLKKKKTLVKRSFVDHKL